MAKSHVYHWKHGWIPLTHTAAMSKAKGNREKAAELLADAKSEHAGIHTREHVGKSALELSHIADARERSDALGDVHEAADRLGAHDVLPKALQRPDTTEQRIARADAAMSADAPLTAQEQAVVDAKFAAAAAKRAQPKAAPKAAPTSRAKGIVLDGRTDEDRYHYRGTDGSLTPQNDRLNNRLKRLEASARKAERDGDMFGAHQHRQEFARLTGEHKSVISYQPGARQTGAAAGLPDGYTVKRDVIDGYGPVSTFSAYGPGGVRVGQAYNSPDVASRAAHKHHERATQAEADRVAMQQRLADEKAAKAAKVEQTMAEGRAKGAEIDAVDIDEQVAVNHLTERMHNSPEAMSPGELSSIVGASHVSDANRERAQKALNEQALRRVQFMDGANDQRAVQARIIDARRMADGPMKTALIKALEQQLVSIGGGRASILQLTRAQQAAQRRMH